MYIVHTYLMDLFLRRKWWQKTIISMSKKHTIHVSRICLCTQILCEHVERVLIVCKTVQKSLIAPIYWHHSSMHELKNCLIVSSWLRRIGLGRESLRDEGVKPMSLNKIYNYMMEIFLYNNLLFGVFLNTCIKKTTMTGYNKRRIHLFLDFFNSLYYLHQIM